MRLKEQRPIRLVNGKFLRGTKEVQPEIGNVEQINLLRKMERRRRISDEGGGNIECLFSVSSIDYTSNINLKCECGNIIQAYQTCSSLRDEDVDDIEGCNIENWQDEIIGCHECSRHYRVNGVRAILLSRK